MVNRLRLNEKCVREADPAAGRDYQIFDTDVRGFAVCIYRSGFAPSPSTIAMQGGNGG